MENCISAQFHSAWQGEKMSYKITVIIEQDEDGYYAYAPELDGCQTQGDTLDEVIKNMQEAVELYAATMTEEELRQAVSTSILTTTLEVAVA
jgi:predicted RNase H-like HicB family nuclease